MERLTTYDPRKGKPVLAGHIENGVFIKQVGGRHLFRKLQAYGIQEEIIQILLEKKVKKIKIISPTITFLSNIDDWVNGHSLIRDYGNGLQRFLPIYYMKKIK